ncbi:MAG: hypothetical protein V4772_08865 [Pseudomonadota bacterium]
MISSSKHKYVKHSELGFVLWPALRGELWHVDVGRAIKRRETSGEIISAGFAEIQNGKVRCYGRSDSLSIDSATGDSAELAEQLGLQS